MMCRLGTELPIIRLEKKSSLEILKRPISTLSHFFFNAVVRRGTRLINDAKKKQD